MTDTTTQTTTSAPTGQAGAAGAPPATSGDATTTAAAAPASTVLGGEKKPEGDGQGQTGEENKTTPATGAEIEVKLPDGVTVDDAVLSEFKTVAKDVGLDSEKASKLASWYAKQQDEAAKSQFEAWEKQSVDWEGEIKANKEFGGEKFSASVANAQKAVLKFGGPPLVAALNKLGIGNLPELAYAFARVGAAMGEDTSSVKPAPGGQVGLSEAERNKLRYNKSQG